MCVCVHARLRGRVCVSVLFLRARGSVGMRNGTVPEYACAAIACQPTRQVNSHSCVQLCAHTSACWAVQCISRCI